MGSSLANDPVLACTLQCWHQTLQTCASIAFQGHLTLRLWARSQVHKLPSLGLYPISGSVSMPLLSLGTGLRCIHPKDVFQPVATHNFGLVWMGRINQAIILLVPNLSPLEPSTQMA